MGGRRDFILFMNISSTIFLDFYEENIRNLYITLYIFLSQCLQMDQLRIHRYLHDPETKIFVEPLMKNHLLSLGF